MSFVNGVDATVPITCDVIILGAGLVGLTAANLCARGGLSVALVEAHPPTLEWSDAEFDNRCSAISKSSQQLFESLGIWDAMVAERVSPYQHMKVWDAQGYGNISFDAFEIGEPNLGHIIENRVMIKALWNLLRSQNNIHVFLPDAPIAFSREDKQVLLQLKSEQVLTAKVIIAADGGNSWLRQTAKIKTVDHDYDQNAVVATITTEQSHEKTAWQRFLKEGPLAFLPLSDPHTCSIVWSTTKAQAQFLTETSDENFCKELAYAFDYRLGKIDAVSSRNNFELKFCRAKQTVEARLALVGDAAHVIHPLAGQGVNLGLLDASVLAKVLIDASLKDYDIGNYLVLRRYERERKGHVLAFMMATDFLKRFFSVSNPVVSELRSVGLQLTDQAKWLKKKMILQAMGTLNLF